MTKLLARTYAEFSAGLSQEAIPADVRAAAYLHVVDTIGVCIAGAAPNEESGQAARRLASKWKATRGATIFGVGSQSRSDTAALVNGALAQLVQPQPMRAQHLAWMPQPSAVGTEQSALLSDSLPRRMRGSFPRFESAVLHSIRPTPAVRRRV